MIKKKTEQKVMHFEKSLSAHVWFCSQIQLFIIWPPVSKSFGDLSQGGVAICYDCLGVSGWREQRGV